MPSYAEALMAEVKLCAPLIKNRIVSTIYIGGGTPSALPPHTIGQLLNTIKNQWKVADDCEITIEANPESIDEQKLEHYLKAGINRISIGLQAWQNRILKYLSRLYTIEEFLPKYQMVQKSGLTNINLDLIFGIPGQTMADWTESLANAIALNPQHLSCYSLELDNNSHFGKMHAKGRFKAAPAELDRAMQRLLIQETKTHGYLQYEMSNFAKPGFECRHNLDFWHFKDYLALGAAGHSCVDGRRFNNPYSIEGYTAAIMSGKLAHTDFIALSTLEQMEDFVILGLRLNDGLSIKRFEDRFNTKFDEHYQKTFTSLISQKMVTKSDNVIKLTERGHDLYNTVVSQIMDVRLQR